MSRVNVVWKNHGAQDFIFVCINRKEARLVVDGAFTASVLQPPGQVRSIELDRRKGLFIGATVERRSGFVGCLRALQVNGVMMDIAKELETNTYGWYFQLPRVTVNEIKSELKFGRLIIACAMLQVSDQAVAVNVTVGHV